MLQIISCKYCGKTDIGFNNTCVTVNFCLTKPPCNCCNHCPPAEEKSDFFCSEKCFKDYYLSQWSNFGIYDRS
jgi:hypothetical protein